MKMILKFLKTYRLFLVLLASLALLAVFRPDIGGKAFVLAGNSTLDMLSLLPPILVLAGLLDQWISREQLMPYLGKNSGFMGILVSLVLGVVSAGPLYAAFPITLILMKKGAALRYIVFILGIWTTAKLPILIFEFASFGFAFTSVHALLGLCFYYLLGLVLERMFDPEEMLLSNQFE